MAQPMRKEVLRAFKALHRARQHIFEGDYKALQAGRLKINEEFRKNKNVTNQDAISELVKLAKEVEKELRTSVIQAVQVSPGKYKVKITEDITKLDNVPFKGG